MHIPLPLSVIFYRFTVSAVGRLWSQLRKSDRLREIDVKATSGCEQAQKKSRPYSITSSARASKVGDTLMSIACAALALMISSNLVGC
jgi:hypothetical protein